MRLNGSWEADRAGVLCPTITVEVRAADGSWQEATFLVDTGADTSVLRYDLLYALQ